MKNITLTTYMKELNKCLNEVDNIENIDNIKKDINKISKISNIKQPDKLDESEEVIKFIMNLFGGIDKILNELEIDKKKGKK